ncbi:unnamed protein product [Rangifer tarandus platyrhynchus]|uniref:Uncharacterized protein n=2 Tax=Rangifer tarandus platyrhynchus TaxID=3082113 RepID=A0ACB0DXM2_RANTA|nr:unnamed protein product [Rangifer tarandus platyrhynchus]CAI9692986.1 unnamed protein product [Rangifer tarandus platyrhynchus]
MGLQSRKADAPRAVGQARQAAPRSLADSGDGGSGPRSTLVPSSEGAVETPKEWAQAASLAELSGKPTTLPYKGFSLPACPPGGSKL